MWHDFGLEWGDSPISFLGDTTIGKIIWLHEWLIDDKKRKTLFINLHLLVITLYEQYQKIIFIFCVKLTKSQERQYFFIICTDSTIQLSKVPSVTKCTNHYHISSKTAAPRQVQMLLASYILDGYSFCPLPST